MKRKAVIMICINCKINMYYMRWTDLLASKNNLQTNEDNFILFAEFYNKIF